MTALEVDHWVAVKRVLCYVKGTFDYGLLYSRSHNSRLLEAGSVDKKTSTSGSVFSLGFGAITWTRKKQYVVSLSSTEVENHIAVRATCEEVLKLAKNPVLHERTKHVDVHCHYICHFVEDGAIHLQYAPIVVQIADILTKPLGLDKFV